MEKNIGRGDIIWVDFGATKGHEQAGKRPALVLSPVEYNTKIGLLIACPITSKVKGYPFEVKLHGKIRGAVLVDQIRSIDWKSRNASYGGKITEDELRAVSSKLDLLLP